MGKTAFDLTLTRVVFEYTYLNCQFFYRKHLTLTRVVFELLCVAATTSNIFI